MDRDWMKDLVARLVYKRLIVLIGDVGEEKGLARMCKTYKEQAYAVLEPPESRPTQARASLYRHLLLLDSFTQPDNGRYWHHGRRSTVSEDTDQPSTDCSVHLYS